MESPIPQIRRGRDRPTTPRLLRELRTLEKMAAIYCRDRHGSPSGLCPECAALMTYAAKRLAVCPFGEDKPVCAKCKVHCYGPASREQVHTIMRCAGPRMMLQHPWLALGHVRQALSGSGQAREPCAFEPLSLQGACFTAMSMSAASVDRERRAALPIVEARSVCSERLQRPRLVAVHWPSLRRQQ